MARSTSLRGPRRPVLALPKRYAKSMAWHDSARAPPIVSKRPRISVGRTDSRTNPVYGWNLQHRLQPFREPFDAVTIRSCRRIAEQAMCLLDAGPGLRDIAGLFRQPLDSGPGAEHVFEAADHLCQRHGLVVPEIDHFVGAARVGHRCAHALDNVVDIRVIPARRAVAVHG